MNGVLRGRPRQFRWVAAVAIVVVASGLLLGPRTSNARQEPNANTNRAVETSAETKELVEAQVKLASKALKLFQDSRRIGAPVRGTLEEWPMWSRKLLESQLFLSMKADEPKAQDVEVYLNQGAGRPWPNGLRRLKITCGGCGRWRCGIGRCTKRRRCHPLIMRKSNTAGCKPRCGCLGRRAGEGGDW